MRKVILSIEQEFVRTHERTLDFLRWCQPGILYKRPRELSRVFVPFTCGEYILRSAAAMEQVFGGITRRLWDDPFEWTLPEKLSTHDLLLEYLAEVDSARKDCFAFFSDDSDLTKEMPSPVETRSISEILLSALSHSNHYQGRAFAVAQMLTDEKLPRI